MSANIYRFLIWASVAISLLPSAAVQAQQASQNQEQQEATDFPERLRDLTDLTPIIERKTVTPLQKTEILLSWLVQERNDPSLTTKGLGGGPIDSGYIQAQLIKGLGVYGDPLAINWLLASSKIKDAGLLDALRLALGFSDRRQIPALIKILTTHPIPDYRMLAADDLYVLEAVEAIPALEKACADKYSLAFDALHKGHITIYPVREAARQSLRNLKNMQQVIKSDPEGVASKRQYLVKFTSDLAKMPEYATTNKHQLSRLLEALQPRISE